MILDGAVLTNPYSHKQMDTAIDSAIDMTISEQIERMEKMSTAVEAFTVSDWADEQIGALESVE